MEKSLLDKDSLESIVEFLEKVEASFRTILTNYTTYIEYGENKSRFLKSFRGRKCFAAYNKIKRDVSQHTPPEVNEESLVYFFHDIRSSFKVHKAIQIDIKKAYATVLKNKGYITSDTYEYISSLNKNDRLASVGMLASVKHEFVYKNGAIENYRTIESDLKNFFLYCVKEVHEIMGVCRRVAGSRYVLTWVDAIYIAYDERLATEIQRILYYNGFDSERSVIYDFTVNVTDSRIAISLNDGTQKKKFNIPHSINLFAKGIANYLTRNERKPFKNDYNTRS